MLLFQYSFLINEQSCCALKMVTVIIKIALARFHKYSNWRALLL